MKMICMLITLLTVLGISLACLCFFSPGKPEALRDTNGKVLPGSISEKIWLRIGGVRQGMFVRSKNPSNPVLLFLHGGPGFPNYFLFEKYNPGLEDYFTVCYWEQRGSGLSYSPEVSRESMTLDQLASDALEVTQYLRTRFGQEKIYLMAWSGGTTIALPVLADAPDLFHAYLGMGQICRQEASERIAYDYMMNHFRECKDGKSVRALEKFNHLASPSDVIAFFNSATRDNLMHSLGIGTMASMKSAFRGIFLPVWTCRAYTIREKFLIWKSKMLFLPSTNLKTQVLSLDYSIAYPEIKVPVYFFSGKYDLTVNTELSRAYYHALKAPFKAFYTFENSAHAPLFEEPQRFREILEKEVLGTKNPGEINPA